MAFGESGPNYYLCISTITSVYHHRQSLAITVVPL